MAADDRRRRRRLAGLRARARGRTGLAARRGAASRPVVATTEPYVDLEAAREFAPGAGDASSETAVHALHTLSEEADLLVVGSRGLRGIRALGSVGERIAHEALCSVLVVRDAVE